MTISMIKDLEAQHIAPVFAIDNGDGPVEECTETPVEAPFSGTTT